MLRKRREALKARRARPSLRDDCPFACVNHTGAQTQNDAAEPCMEATISKLASSSCSGTSRISNESRCWPRTYFAQYNMGNGNRQGVLRSLQFLCRRRPRRRSDRHAIRNNACGKTSQNTMRYDCEGDGCTPATQRRRAVSQSPARAPCSGTVAFQLPTSNCASSHFELARY